MNDLFLWLENIIMGIYAFVNKWFYVNVVL